MLPRGVRVLPLHLSDLAPAALVNHVLSPARLGTAHRVPHNRNACPAHRMPPDPVELSDRGDGADTTSPVTPSHVVTPQQG
nr:hypothetical protein GCM10020241_55180 [Streptoalloteichus tenebrarius]